MRAIITSFFVTSSFLGLSQEYPRSTIDFSRLTDDLVSYQDEDLNFEDIYENYVQLFSNPLNINSATPEELRLLNILSENQLDQLFKYRKENGNLLSIYELQSIPDFDLLTIQKIIPFVVATDVSTSSSSALIKRMLHNNNSYFIARYERTLEKSAGYENDGNNNAFKGSPDKLYYRFKNSIPNDYSFGFTAEKDQGEAVQWNPKNYQYGFDYLSYHLQIVNKKKLKSLILGDFQYQFGQGLVLGNAFGLGKGGETVITTRKSNIGLLPYTSVNEAGYLRGGAFTYLIGKRIFLSGFYSNTFRDANVEGQEDPTFSTISVTGLHRSERELEQRKQIREQNYGSIVNYKYRGLDAGLIFQTIHFNIPVEKKATAYNQFSFHGEENLNASIFINYTVRNFTLFTETAKSFDGGFASVGGVLASLNSKLDLSLLYRRYDKDFYPFYANGFSENTVTQNERGVYWGLKCRFNRKYNIAGYADLFTFPWLKYRTYAPSIGSEYLLRFNYQPAKKIITFVQFRQETKERNSSEVYNLYEIEKGVKRNLWINLDYTVHPQVRMKTRAQFSDYNFDASRTHGMALLQDVIIDFGKLEVSARHALFDTEDYDNRQYVYENDVWLAFSLPALDGVGVRNYALVEYKFSKRLSAWIRYARTAYSNKDEIGTGLQKISENTKNDIKLQLLIRL
jgi:hypothetical protein